MALRRRRHDRLIDRGYRSLGQCEKTHRLRLFFAPPRPAHIERERVSPSLSFSGLWPLDCRAAHRLRLFMNASAGSRSPFLSLNFHPRPLFFVEFRLGRGRFFVFDGTKRREAAPPTSWKCTRKIYVSSAWWMFFSTANEWNHLAEEPERGFNAEKISFHSNERRAINLVLEKYWIEWKKIGMSRVIWRADKKLIEYR